MSSYNSLGNESIDLMKKFKSYIEKETLSYTEMDLFKISEWIKKNDNDNFSPYVYIEMMKLYISYTNKHTKTMDIMDMIIKKKLLFYKSKRYPMLELIFKVFYEWKPAFDLDEDEVNIILFSIKLGYSYPGIVGTAYNIYAIKDEYISKEYKEINRKIINSQNSTNIEGINTEYWISQTKGGLSLDLGFGCSMGCLYCYRIEDHQEMYSKKWKPNFHITSTLITERLLAHPWFTPHVTPLGLHMSTTEAFLPQIWPVTIEILEKLDSYKLTNRITIITKEILGENEIERLEALKYLDLDVCVCYSSLSVIIEPSSSIKRLKFLERLVNGGKIVPIAYFRPLIEGYNTTEDIVRETLNKIKKSKAKVVVYGGLLFSEEHNKNFKQAGLNVPECNFVKNKKFMSESTEKMIKKLYDEIFIDIDSGGLFRHSSCGRVNARGEWLPDYNCHYYMDTSNRCYERCAKKGLCMNPIKPNDKDFSALVERLFWSDAYYEMSDKNVKFDRKLTLYENNFIRQNTLFPIDTEIVQK